MARSKGMTKTGGRRKGTPNKLTVDLKEMILGALNAKGGQRSLSSRHGKPGRVSGARRQDPPLTLQGNSQQPITFQVVTGVSRTVDANDRACRENTEDGPRGPFTGGLIFGWRVWKQLAGIQKDHGRGRLVPLDVCRWWRRRRWWPGVDARSWQWSYEGSEPHARIGYEANLIDADAAWLRLTYTASGNPMDYRVRLVTTEPTYGGRRWWFLVP